MNPVPVDDEEEDDDDIDETLVERLVGRTGRFINKLHYRIYIDIFYCSDDFNNFF